jgi:hypothetical protein
MGWCWQEECRTFSTYTEFYSCSMGENSGGRRSGRPRSNNGPKRHRRRKKKSTKAMIMINSQKTTNWDVVLYHSTDSLCPFHSGNFKLYFISESHSLSFSLHVFSRLSGYFCLVDYNSSLQFTCLFIVYSVLEIIPQWLSKNLRIWKQYSMDIFLLMCVQTHLCSHKIQSRGHCLFRPSILLPFLYEASTFTNCSSH